MKKRERGGEEMRKNREKNREENRRGEERQKEREEERSKYLLMKESTGTYQAFQELPLYPIRYRTGT